MAVTEERQLLDRLVAEGYTELQSPDPRLRDAARRSGWSGTLRGPLHHGGGRLPEDAVAAVAALVPGAGVAPAPPPGPLRGLVRLALAGMPGTAELVVTDGTGLRPFSVRYPDRPDLFVEELARAVDVTVAMRARFRSALGHVRLVAIDFGPQGFRTSRYAGIATPTLGNVHLNAALFLPGPLAELEAVREVRAARPGATPSARPGGDFTAVDGTTAHELWHQVELAFTARDYRASVEFRRLLGAWFGVETIEQAAGRGGPVQDRVAAEVSPYGATRPLEATAEMAKLWWCGSDAPVARYFGEVVERFFPAPTG
ncbi:MAG TPA: hypothetical protein VFJ85_04950 [Acidimicrobiales bacterium]|nr:hypothetical protein [Acidimicrobiales bacterium]